MEKAEYSITILCRCLRVTRSGWWADDRVTVMNRGPRIWWATRRAQRKVPTGLDLGIADRTPFTLDARVDECST